jgi:methylglyoxal synthase
MNSSIENPKKKAVIGVLASYDSHEKNRALADCFTQLYSANTSLLTSFQFLFTGGTFQRLLVGWEANGEWREPFLMSPVREAVLANSTCLPERKKGGVTVLANYLVNRQISIIWAFFDPVEAHWLNPENLALMRLCDVWRVKRLRNSGSLLEWFATEADRDSMRNKQPVPPPLKLRENEFLPPKKREFKPREESYHAGEEVGPYELSFVELDPDRKPTIALIAHDEMKPRMVDFAVQYERELGQFDPIFATGTTGKEVGEAAPTLDRPIWRFHSGPKGGDIQIATMILFARCDVVIFFLDPLRPHPHADDIRVVLSACMVENNVRILTNDVEARDWMDEVVAKDRLREAIQRIRKTNL